MAYSLMEDWNFWVVRLNPAGVKSGSFDFFYFDVFVGIVIRTNIQIRHTPGVYVMITILGNVCQFSAKNGILLRKPILQTFDTIFEKYVRSLKRHFGSHRLRIYFKIITSVLGIAKRTYWPRLAAIFCIILSELG
jgi:hypothetical protein